MVPAPLNQSGSKYQPRRDVRNDNRSRIWSPERRMSRSRSRDRQKESEKRVSELNRPKPLDRHRARERPRRRSPSEERYGERQSRREYQVGYRSSPRSRSRPRVWDSTRGEEGAESRRDRPRRAPSARYDVERRRCNENKHEQDRRTGAHSEIDRRGQTLLATSRDSDDDNHGPRARKTLEFSKMPGEIYVEVSSGCEQFPELSPVSFKNAADFHSSDLLECHS
jgi:hypothetical protein